MLIDLRGGRPVAPRHGGHGELPLGSPPWRRQARRRGDATPCPPHHPSTPSPARRDSTAAEGRLRAHLPCPRARRTPRDAVVNYTHRTAPTLPLLPSLLRHHATSTTDPSGAPQRNRPVPSARVRAAVRHGEQRTPPQLHAPPLIPPDQPTVPEAAQSSPQPRGQPLWTQLPSSTRCTTSTASPSSPIKGHPAPVLPPRLTPHSRTLHSLSAPPGGRSPCIPASAAQELPRGSAGEEGGRRSRPSRAALSPSLLCLSLASPLHPRSPAVFWLCFVHSSAAEGSPELQAVTEGVQRLAVDDSRRPSTHHSAQTSARASAVDLHHLRVHPSP